VNVLDYLEDELLSCLCSMLRDEGRPACACHHYGGEDPPVGDRCSKSASGENGQVWIRRVLQLMQADPDNITFAGFPCGGGMWRAVIELGIYRCISAVPVEGGAAPPPENYDADRDLLAADRATLAQVLCCWPLAGSPPEPLPFEIGLSVLNAEIVPTGPSGACAGSILTLTVDAPLTVEEPVAQLVATVDADDADPTGMTAAVTWRNEPAEDIFVSRPAGGG
jgi:hypothetical protein